ncbi:uncharacterized protein [Haliotis cracherodii]|uniref:uncharacterized protein n=1 Tax=Haliotis cracherodii TaxID=6455 RepID=UPI0039EA5831
MEFLFPIDENVYYNVSLVFALYQCRLHNTSSRTDAEDPDVIVAEDEEGDEDVFESAASESSLWGKIKGFFGSPQDETVPLEKPVTITEQECVTVINFSQERSFNANILLNWTCVVLATCVLAMLIWFLFYCLIKRMYGGKEKQDQSSSREEIAAEVSEDFQFSQSGMEDVLSPGVELPAPTDIKPAPNKCAMTLTIIKPGCNHEFIRVNKTDTKCFLSSTVDKFLCELDKALGISSESFSNQPMSMTPNLATSASSGAISNLVSPRLGRRSTWRRPRQGSPSLPLGDLSLMGDDQTTKDKHAWHEVERMNTRLGWSSLKTDDIDFGNIENRNLRDVLTFHIRNCPVTTEQWFAASMIVNYTLLMLEKELHKAPSSSSFRFVEFKGIGSVAKGLKISKANQFDTAMIIQPSECVLNNVLYHNVSEDIPSGKVLLSVKDMKQEKKQKQYTKRASVSDSIGTYLLPKEILTLCKELVDQAIQRLMNSNKSLLDRLPFSIRTAADGDLQLILDTRMLHGLGLGIPEIGIRLCPAIPLMNTSLSLLPTVYAVTPWVVKQQVRRPSSSSMRIFRDRVESLDPDLMWNLSFCDLESSYLAAMDQKLQLAGITGCHKICLRIMKALFTSGYKTSLLSRGEIQSYQLETILFFLLLESAPCNWTMEKLADRVSDCVHFLRSALQSMWLPSFFVNNPHLEKQMPALKLYPLLTGGRQDNLLANMKQETVEKVISFIEQRLQEVGLQGCIKEEYSLEMWEYEFFIFG